MFHRMVNIAGVFLWMLGASMLAQRSVPLTLEKMVVSSGAIVHGRIIRMETGKDSVTGLPATWVTLSVAEGLYGVPATSYTFKQYGGRSDGAVMRLADAPRFSVGQEMVLLLYPPSQRSGFSSPVGMSQGVFRVSMSSRGKHVEPLEPTAALTKSPSLRSVTRTSNGAMDLTQFKSVLRSLVQQKQAGLLR